MRDPAPAPTGYWCLRLGRFSLLLHRRSTWLTLVLAILLLALMLLAVGLGSGNIGSGQALATLFGQGSRMQELLVFRLRLPRIAAVLVAGAAMGLAGCLIQTLVRNRLATPDMVGVNEGASLSIILFSLYLTLGSWPWWAAPLGAAGAALALYGLCRRPGEQGYLFVVVGIALSELFGALGDFAMSTQSLVHLGSLYLWSMGHFAGKGYSELLPIGLLLLLLCPLLMLVGRPLAVLRFGDATARSLGVNVSRLQLFVLGLAILVAALGTAIGGPVVFIAMSAPILASRLCRGQLAPLWLAALSGAMLLLASDTLVRVLAQPHEVPTGIMTRILGGLVLLVLLFNDRQKAD